MVYFNTWQPSPWIRTIMIKQIKQLLMGVVLVAMLIINPGKVIAEDNIANQMSFSEPTTEQLIDFYSIKYGADAKQIRRIGICESKLSMNPPGHNDGGLAVGMFQYHQALWSDLQKEMGEKLDRYSKHDQIKATAYALSHGYAYKWTCK